MTDVESTEDDFNDEPLYGPSDVIAVLDRLAEMVGSSRQVPLTASVMVNRAEVLELIENAREALPHDLVRAERVVADATAVLDRADLEAEQAKGDADEYARATRAEADRYHEELHGEADEYARATRTEAEDEAERILAKAKEQGRDILEQTNARAKQMVEEGQRRATEAASQEAVYREAVARGDEYLAQAKQKAQRMVDEAHRYASDQLSELEQTALALAKSARAGRENLERR